MGSGCLLLTRLPRITCLTDDYLADPLSYGAFTLKRTLEDLDFTCSAARFAFFETQHVPGHQVLAQRAYLW
jgi:hypothetical protein